ncbi:unknown [Prevotella sp. CAG:924]|nr:unknown [Prevotella sp. CAG:924]
MDVFVSVAFFCYEFLCGTDINIWAYSRCCYESRKQIIRNDIYWVFSIYKCSLLLGCHHCV